MQQTLAIIRPSVVAALKSGDIITLIEKNNFVISLLWKKLITEEECEKLYAEHRSKAFFPQACKRMTENFSIILVLEKNNAIQEWRNLIGATNPLLSSVGSLRKIFGSSIYDNGLHGSDSEQAAIVEKNIFFPYHT